LFALLLYLFLSLQHQTSSNILFHNKIRRKIKQKTFCWDPFLFFLKKFKENPKTTFRKNEKAQNKEKKTT